MHERTLPGVGESFDHCEKCGGLFLDFFDGDPSDVARSLHGTLGDKPTGAVEGSVDCPDCERPMALEPYLDSQLPLYRCGTCAGAFVTAGMFRELAKYEVSQPSESWLKRLLAWLNAGLGS